jgi:threonine dehydrogenase-like Zn-dependent dehydrogenase
MAQNSGVVYLGQNKVEVQSIDFPTMKNPAGKDIKHGVILKVVSTNICDSATHGKGSYHRSNGDGPWSRDHWRNRRSH